MFSSVVWWQDGGAPRKVSKIMEGGEGPVELSRFELRGIQNGLLSLENHCAKRTHRVILHY